MKKSIFTLLILFVCTVQTATAYEYFTIYFSDGTKSEAFYATDVDSICYSKLSLDSIAYDDWQVQEIYTCDSVYRYPLAQIDSLSFKDVDVNIVSNSIADVSSSIAPLFIQCKSTTEISSYLPAILNIEGVESAWTDNMSLFVKIQDWGIMTFSYQPIGEQTVFSSPTRRMVKKEGINSFSSPYKACIVNQVPKDEGRNKSEIIGNLQKYFEEMGISCTLVNRPSPSFFQTGFFDYDLIFLIGHGDYDGVNHWLYTGEEIFCSGDVNEIDTKTFAKLSEQADAFFKFLHPEESSNMVSNSWVCEKRNGVDVLVWYTKVSEHYIASTQRDFFGKNAAIFNVACQSLKGSESLAKTFLDKGAECYLGYTETNNIGAEGGQSFFKNLMSGLCGYGSKQIIPSIYCTQIWNNGTEPVLVLLPNNEKKTKQYRITIPETLNTKTISAGKGDVIQMQGRMRMQNFNNTDKYIYGFLYSKNSDMSQSKNKAVQGNYDNNTLYMNWEATLTESDLQPNTTYYYRAYMNDGFNDCFGEIKQFMVEDRSNYIAYAVLEDSTLSFYYDDKIQERSGERKTMDEYTTWWSNRIIKVIFDSSFAYYTPVSTADWFNSCHKLKIIENINFLNTTNVTNMSCMFGSCSSLTSLDLSSFNTANVTNMTGMFYGCASLTNLDLSSFNTANVTNMASMFYDCFHLTSLDLSSFNTANVTNMGGMFYDCASLTNLDLSSFNTANVTNMASMFYDCFHLTSLDLSSFNTANVTNMYSMFRRCYSLTSLDLSSFNTANVTNMHAMFNGCSSLTNLDLSSFNTANVTDMYAMFSGCSSLTSLDLSSFNTANVTDMSSMFGGCSSLTSLDFRNLVLVGDVGQKLFVHLVKLQSINLSNANTANVTNMHAMFNGCSSLTSLDLSSFNTANVTNMHAMFNGCSSLTSLDLSSFNTANVTDMYAMFSGCSSLTSLDLSSFNTANVTDMMNMFSDCSSLTSLDLSSFNTANVTNMSGMFWLCSSLTSLDLSSFNTANVTYTHNMFFDCSSLKTIYAGNWSYYWNNTGKNIFMFVRCDNLRGGMGTKIGQNLYGYDKYGKSLYYYCSDDAIAAHIDGGKDNPGLFTAK